MRYLSYLLLLLTLPSSSLWAQRVVPNTIVTNGAVEAIVRRNDTLFLGGSFTQAGYLAGRAALVTPDSPFPDSNFPRLNSTVEVAAADGAGGWYLGGNFTRANDEDVSRLLHVLADGTIDPTFRPEPNGSVSGLTMAGDLLYVWGNFTQIGNTSVDYLTSISKTTGVGTGWDAQLNPNQVRSLLVNGDDVYVGGSFTQIGGRAERYLAVLDATTAQPRQYLSTNSTVETMELRGDTLYLGGGFTVAGYYTGRAARVTTSATVPDYDFPTLNGSVSVVLPDGTGGWYLGGSFTQSGGNLNRLIHVLADGSIDLNFVPNPNSTVTTLALDGSRLYVGGSFTQIGGISAARLAAVNRTTGTAIDWQPNATNGVINDIMPRGGTIYVGGSFTQIGGQTRNYLAALDSVTGDALTGFDPRPNSTVQTLLRAGDVLYVGGSFTQFGTNPSVINRRFIASVDLTNNTVTNWNPNANSTVMSMRLRNDTLFAGGSFTQIGGQPRARLAALRTT
ncbi:MAG: hypothetical protein WBA12_03590, partial [Catalinimonas sp.]